MKYITFDTSFLEHYNYDFYSPLYSCSSFQQYEVIISDVIDKEIVNHLRERASHIKPWFKELLLLKKDKEFTNCFDNVYLEKKVLEKYESFKKQLNIKVVSSSKADVSLVVDNYFQKEGAFEKTGKKDEFPDAIAISSLINYVNGSEINVFSLDDDWKNGLKKYHNAKFYENKDDLINLLGVENVYANAIFDFFEAKKSYYDNILYREYEKEVTNNPYKIDNEYPNDKYCEEFEFVLDEIKGVEILSIKNNIMEAVVLFSYSFKAVYDFDDYESACYDSELDKWFFC